MTKSMKKPPNTSTTMNTKKHKLLQRWISFNKIISTVIVLAVIFNHWILVPLVHQSDGQVNIPKIALTWVIDAFCIVAAVILIFENRSRFVSPKTIIFAGIMISMMLMVSEGFLQIAARLSPGLNRMLSPEATVVSIRPVIYDPRLGYRGNPDYPEHDRNGFRNETALSNATIVALGDSQVYGTSVKRDQAWPQQLAELSGQSVYNMGLGGYGAVQSLILMESEAVQLNPRHILFMMYDGNDAYDAYNAVYSSHLYDTFKATDPETLQTLHRLDHSLDTDVQVMTEQFWEDKSASPSRPKSLISKLKLVQLLSALKGRIQTIIAHRNSDLEIPVTLQQDHSDAVLYEHFSCPDFKTTFTPQYRTLGMNLEDPRIREGLRIHLKAIQRMKVLADLYTVQFTVVLLPTKELVFNDLYRQYTSEQSESLRTTVRLNNEIRNLMLDDLDKHGIAYVDALPVLKACLKRKEQPFFQNADGHLNETGHHAIAESLLEIIGNQAVQTSKADILYSSTKNSNMKRYSTLLCFY
mgnify:CR=1 FL=1